MCYIPRMTQENRTAQILYTHYYQAYNRDNKNCDEAGVIDFQLKLLGIETIRLIRLGKLKPSEDILQSLRQTDLEFDFSDLN